MTKKQETDQASIKIYSEPEYGESARVVYDSKDYPEFKGKTRDEFIRYCIESNLDLTGLDLREVILKEITISGKDLSNTNFFRAEMNEVVFEECKLEKTIFAEAALVNSKINHCFGYLPYFRETLLNKVEVIECNFNNASFEGATLWEVTVAGGSYTGTTFRLTKFSRTTMKGCYLWGSDFSQATLDCLDFTDSCLENVKFSFSTGFDVASEKDAYFYYDRKKGVTIAFGYMLPKRIAVWDQFFSPKCNDPYITKFHVSIPRDSLEFSRIKAYYLQLRKYVEVFGKTLFKDFEGVPPYCEDPPVVKKPAIQTIKEPTPNLGSRLDKLYSSTGTVFLTQLLPTYLYSAVPIEVANIRLVKALLKTIKISVESDSSISDSFDRYKSLYTKIKKHYGKLNDFQLMLSGDSLYNDLDNLLTLALYGKEAYATCKELFEQVLDKPVKKGWGLQVTIGEKLFLVHTDFISYSSVGVIEYAKRQYG
jgi:uncharacterized protein YjbI with pentapeptide repeats